MSKRPANRGAFQTLASTVNKLGAGIVILLLLVLGFWGGHLLGPGHGEADMERAQSSTERSLATSVTLPMDKVESAGIQTVPVERVELQEMKTVAATVDYDATRHLAVRAPVECVLERWWVRPGDHVEKGDVIAALSGTEIALARSEVKKCEADLRVAQINFNWNVETQDNLADLLDMLKRSPTVEEVEEKFKGKVLGHHRDHLLGSYSKFTYASSVAQRAAPLGGQGVIAGKTVQSRLNQRDVASTEFKSACEQSEFESRRALAKTRAELQLATRSLAVSKERLRLLLGPLADDSTEESGGRFEMRAPFAGRIEGLSAAPTSRLQQGEAILTLADTSKLWVSSLIHQHDWDALQVAPGKPIQVAFPALPKEYFEAIVSFVGPEVSPATRALSLVAVLKNQSGRFRPGMFAWVELPMEPARTAMVLPTSSVLRHDGATFVFVSEGKNQFRRVDVEIGLEQSGQIEIAYGLAVGQHVVHQGAFFLKSELLLEQEAE